MKNKQKRDENGIFFWIIIYEWIIPIAGGIYACNAEDLNDWQRILIVLGAYLCRFLHRLYLFHNL